MPYCPNCRYEYEEGVETCPDCGADLVKRLPPRPRTIDEDLVSVYVAESDLEARMVRNVLEEAGIPVWEKDEIVTGVDPFPVDPFPEDSVLVPKSREEQAKKAIETALESAKRLPLEEGEASE